MILIPRMAIHVHVHMQVLRHRAALEWLRSYLTGRTQVFTTHSGQPHPIPLKSDVPQGSSLGPAFISYTECTTNIFSLTLRSISHVMFADDSQSYSHCAISEIPALVHQVLMHRRPRQILCFPTASTQIGENRVHLVRFTRYLTT